MHAMTWAHCLATVQRKLKQWCIITTIGVCFVLPYYFANDTNLGYLQPGCRSASSMYSNASTLFADWHAPQSSLALKVLYLEHETVGVIHVTVGLFRWMFCAGIHKF